ncbi:MAG: Swt1 family HEPN domain-containing protein [Planctomycetota bacterium]
MNNDLYSFVFRGQIAQTAINDNLRNTQSPRTELGDHIRRRLPLDQIEKNLVEAATNMAFVYTAIAAFENSARKFIAERLLEEYEANWWDDKVSSAIKKQAEKRKADEANNRYHGSRGTSLIYYCQMGDLASIINANEEAFTDYIPSTEWARQIFKSIEMSRNVIMHSGQLSMNDIERVSMNIRDWVTQVGG